MKVVLDFTQVDIFKNDLTAAALRAPSESGRITKQYGDILMFAVRTNASGRPGPEPITGEYRSSIMNQYSETGNKASSEVITYQPQGFRLEYGFYGTDSIGREADTAPYPHFMPALHSVSPVWENALGIRMMELVWKGK